MRILVSGGAGFIGSHLVVALLHEPLDRSSGSSVERVTVLDRLTYAANLANLAAFAGDPRLDVVIGDVRDPAVVQQVSSGQDAIVHLAAESHVDRSIADASPFVASNVMGTQILLDAAARNGVGRFVQVSTDEVYGSIDDGAWHEDSPIAPRSPYAASKAAADLLALAYHHTHGLDVVVTRGCNTYGPRQYPEKIVPLFITRLLAGEEAPLYGDGGQVRQWIHVTDHCTGLRLAMQHGRAGQVYHLGGNEALTNAELATRLVALCDADPDLVRQVEDRPGHDRRYRLEIGKARRELGFQPTIGLDEGLDRTVRWYREHPDWWPAPVNAPAAGRWLEPDLPPRG